MPQTELKRSLSLTLLVLYGLGTTIGAGIYVLIGKVAGQAGLLSPVSFLVAALVAVPTALSFGTLAARYPKSAGEAIYVEEAFGHPGLSRTVGLAVVFVGLVSSAAIAAGAVGYLQNILPLPSWAGLLLVVAALGLIAAWGITESVGVTAVATLLEVGGLILIVWFGRSSLDPVHIADMAAAAPPSRSGFVLAGILSGAVLAFYAFIGFEDMVNVSEEVRDPSRNMPRAIVLTLAVTAVLYVLVSLVSVTTIPIDALSASKAPMSDILRRLTGMPTYAFDALVVAAVMNGALVQTVMASRVLYGLARQGWLPSRFGAVSARTRTPLMATLAVSGGIYTMALTLPLEGLARVASFVTLLIFAMVNASLLRIRLRSGARSDRMPRALLAPGSGLALSIALAGFQVAEVLVVPRPD